MNADLDLEDLSPKTLRKMLRALLAKNAGKASDEEKEADDDKAEEERTKLSDLHAEKKGKSEEVPVTEDDLPFELRDESASEDGEEESEETEIDDEEEDAPKAKKPFPKKK